MVFYILKMSRKILIKKWDKYGKLTIIKEIYWYKRRYFESKCKCWNITINKLDYLRTWKTKSCWCLAKNNLDNKTHWMTKTRIYKIYQWIKQRCYNLNHKFYNYYWWRWIKCEWETFENFYEDMKEWYSDKLTIERNNNDWNYEKSNCRWATMKEQTNNKRNTISIEFNWKLKTLKEWSNIIWVEYKTVWWRYNKWRKSEKILNKHVR
jgi:hypothetical protein